MYVIAQYYTFWKDLKVSVPCRMIVELDSNTFADKISTKLMSLALKRTHPSLGRGRGEFDDGDTMVTSRKLCQRRIPNCRKPHEIFYVMHVHAQKKLVTLFYFGALRDSALIAIASVRYTVCKMSEP